MIQHSIIVILAENLTWIIELQPHTIMIRNRNRSRELSDDAKEMNKLKKKKLY